MPPKIRFGSYELDTGARELSRSGRKVALSDQPLRVLTALLEKPGEVVTREELQRRIWPDTFVDFEQSLNRAVNRLRETLHDEANRPVYIETVPRRGYRFIAPVIQEVGKRSYPEAEDSSAPTLVDARNLGPRGARWPLILTGIAAGLFLTGSVSWLWHRHVKVISPREPQLIASDGFDAALSRDGKMLAYSSIIGTGGPQILLQQAATTESLPLTNGTGNNFAGNFSIDGTQIAFWRENIGIFAASSLRGQPRLLVPDPQAKFPRFSPDGSSILYLRADRVMLASIRGGVAADLPLNRDFRVEGPPLWSPDGDAIVFYGSRRDAAPDSPRWWVAPLYSGRSHVLKLPGIEENYLPSIAVRDWVRTIDHREWIVYSTCDFLHWKLWRIAVNGDGDFQQAPELMASGADTLLYGISLSEDGKLLYGTANMRATIFAVPITVSGQKAGPSFQVPLPDGGTYASPAIARDSRRMVYIAANRGGRSAVMLRDLATNTDLLLDDQGRRAQETNYVATIAPDGSSAVFERDCDHGVFPENHQDPLPCTFIRSAARQNAELLCEHCRPRGLSSNGAVLLAEQFDQDDPVRDRIISVDLRSRSVQPFLSDNRRPALSCFVLARRSVGVV